MSRTRRIRSWNPVVAVAAVGVVAGHWAAYALAFPELRTRAAVLAVTGHSYWKDAVRSAVVLALVSVAGVVLRELAARLHPEHGRPVSGLALWAQLATLQAVGFTGMEVTERLVAHAPVAGMFAHQVFVLGLAVQVVAALVGAALLRCFAAAAERLVSDLARSAVPGPSRAGSAATSAPGLAPAFAARPVRARAPPRLLAA